MEPQILIPQAFERLFEKHRYKVLEGGRGGGKSETVGRYILIKGMEKARKIVCGREYQSSIKESVYDMLVDFIERYKLSSFYTVQKTEIIGINGTSFTFAGLHHNIASIKSMYDVDIFWGEEAQVFSANSLEILLPTIRAVDSELIFTMNAELEDDPAYQMLVVNPPPDTLHLKVNYDQNPYFPENLQALMEDQKAKNYQRYLEIWEGNCKAAVEGSIYSQALQKARDEGRIGEYSYDDRYPVSCFWDIGWNDHTSIVFLQFINHEPRVIDCYQNQFQKTPHYVQVLNERKYIYDRLVLPHDSENEHGNAEKTWLQIVRQAFPNARVYAGKRQAIELRLEATKNIFDMLRMDKVHCADLISALAHYHFAIDPETKRQTREPFHGPESNFADAFGYMCLEMKETKKKAPVRPRELPRYLTGRILGS